jgi:hypothetical protein
MGVRGQSPEDFIQRTPGGWSGIAVGKVRDDGPKGLIEFVRCTSENTGREAVRLFDKSSKGTRVVFRECSWKNAWTARHREYGGPRVPILIRCQEPEFCQSPGGAEFIQCRVMDSVDAPTVRFEDDTMRAVLREVHGVISVLNPHGAKSWLGSALDSVDLRVTAEAAAQ